MCSVESDDGTGIPTAEGPLMYWVDPLDAVSLLASLARLLLRIHSIATLNQPYCDPIPTPSADSTEQTTGFLKNVMQDSRPAS